MTAPEQQPDGLSGDEESTASDHAILDRTAHLEAAEGAMVRAEDLIAGYIPGVNILNHCDFYAHEGELVGIIGPRR
jgi:branched-chain amino acid transport system ATP-binding protein